MTKHKHEEFDEAEAAETSRSRSSHSQSRSRSRSHQQQKEQDEDDIEAMLAKEELAISQMDLGELDITTNQQHYTNEMDLEMGMELDMDEIDENLTKFSSDKLISEALSKGVDLKVYSQQIIGDVSASENEVLLEYCKNAEELLQLFSTISTSKNVINSIFTLLNQFQSNLVEMTEEISTLQNQSLKMSTKINNRNRAQKQLGYFLKSSNISEDVKSTLRDGEMNDDYSQSLEKFDQFMHSSKWELFEGALALEEIIPQVEELKHITIHRVKRYLLETFHVFSSSNATPQSVIQAQKSLLTVPYFYTYLLRQCQDDEDRSPDVAQVIRDNYVDIMSKFYLNRWKKYFHDVKKLILENNVEKTDLLAVEEGKKSGLLNKKKTREDLNRIFSLSTERETLIFNPQNEAIVPPAPSEKNLNKVPFERVFASVLNQLIACVESEYDFVVGFFGEKVREEDDESTSATIVEESLEEKTNDHSEVDESAVNGTDTTVSRANSSSPPHSPSSHSSSPRKPVSREGSRPSLSRQSSTRLLQERGREHLSATSKDKQTFTGIWTKTTAYIGEQIEAFLFQNYDMLSMIVIIRTLQHHQALLNEKKIFMFDFFIDRLVLMIWPKVKQIIDANIESVSKVPSAPLDINLPQPSTTTASTSGFSFKKKPVQAAAALPTATSSRHNGLPLPSIHYIFQRYAEFAVAISVLNNAKDEILSSSMRRLRGEIDKLIQRGLNRQGPSKLQNVQLIQIYHSILIIFHSKKNDRNRAAIESSEDLQSCSAMVQSQLTIFIEDEIKDKFGRLATLVPQLQHASETITSSATAAAADIDWNAIDQTVKHFAKYWKDGMEALYNSVSKYFDTTHANSSRKVTAENSKGSEGSGEASNANSPEMNDKIGEVLLKQLFVAFVLLYQKFCECLKKILRFPPPKSTTTVSIPTISKEIVPLSTVMFEMKKYTQ